MNTEERLRAALARGVAHVGGSEEEAWRAIQDRIQRRTGPSVQRAVAALVALVVAGTAIGISFWALGRHVQRTGAVILPERIAFLKPAPNHEAPVTFDIFTVRPDGTDPRNVTNGMAAEGPAAWSGDGSTVAFVHRSGGGSTKVHAGVYVMRADGTNVREVVPCEASYGRLPCDIRDIALSPDGSRLAWTRFGSGLTRSFDVIRTDGTGHREISCTVICGLGIGPLVWSPDGTRIAFGGDLASMRGDIGPPPVSPLYVADVGTGRVTRLPDVTTGSPYPSWSPDSFSLVMTWDRVSATDLNPTLTHDIAVIDADGTGRRTILRCAEAGCSEPEAPVWSQDGTRFAFIDRSGSAWEIWIVGTDGRVMQRLQPCAGSPCSPDSLAWSPDGRRLAFQAIAPDRQAWDLYVVEADDSHVSPLISGTDGILAWLPSVRAKPA